MVKFFLSLNSQVIQLPVPPAKYEVDEPWKNQQQDGLYQAMNLIGISGLKAISITSFFPIESHSNYPFLQNTSMWGKEYVDLIENWRAQRSPIRLIARGTYHDLNMLTTIDDFKHSVGQDGDIDYTLAMTEYVLPVVS